MKTINKITLFFSFLLISSGIFAQGSKIGYVRADVIFEYHPEAKNLKSQLQTHQLQLQTKIKNLEDELIALEQQIKDPNITPEMRQIKEQSYGRKLNDYQYSQQEAQLELQTMQIELLGPLEQKIQAEINNVATELGYDYILNAGMGEVNMILFAKNENDDITAAVLAKFGVTLPSPTANATNGQESTNPAETILKKQ